MKKIVALLFITMTSLVQGKPHSFSYYCSQIGIDDEVARERIQGRLKAQIRKSKKVQIDLKSIFPEGKNVEGQRFFVPISALHPGQSWLSFKLLCKSLEASVTDDVIPKPRYDSNRSVKALSQAKFAVLGPGNLLVLADGHHSTTAAILSGATTHPIYILKDLRHLKNEEEFWKHLASLQGEDQLIFLENYEGNADSKPVSSFADFRDDIMRPYVDLVISPVSSTDKKGELQLKVESPLCIGLRHEETIPPFAEMKIAHLLWRKNVRFDKNLSGSPEREQVEAMLKVMREESETVEGTLMIHLLEEVLDLEQEGKMDELLKKSQEKWPEVKALKKVY